jgi:hypothetical protein
MDTLSHGKAEDGIIEKKIMFLGLGVRLKKYRRYPNSIVSMVGKIHYERSALVPVSKEDKKKFHALGYKGFIYPWDEALDISHLPFKMTVPAMLEVTKCACTCDSYEDTEQLLREKTNIHINDDTIRNVTNVVGSIIYNRDIKEADLIWKNNPPWKFKESTQKENHTLYLEVDGAMVPTREKDEKGGSAWKENKLGMAFSTDNFLNWVDKHGEHQHRILKKEFMPLIGTAENFTPLFYALALRNGYGTYKNTVLLSDGATWIRSMKEQLFGDSCQQILDFFHLSEKISTFAKNIFFNNEENYKPWAKKVSDLFKSSESDKALNEIKSLKPSLLKNASFDLLQYIENNRDNIDYKAYKEKGFFIGSGAIESANRTVMQRRMKLPGMRWNVDTAQNMVTLTAKYRSGLWEKKVVVPICEYYGLKQPFCFNRA